MTASVPTTHPPIRGNKRWRNWLHEPPDWISGRHTLVECWRQGWPDAETLDIRTLPPWFNLAGIYWCPLSQPNLEPEIVSHAA
jgi:hypothetical protein